MKRIITSIFIPMFLCAGAAYCEITPEQATAVTLPPIPAQTQEETKPQEQIATAPEDDMFAPIELDLTDYTYMNKKNKRFKLTAEKVAKPNLAESTGDVWSEDKLFRYNFYSDETNLRTLPCYGSLGSYVTKNLDENTSVMIGQDGITSINGDTVNFAYANSSYYSSGARLDGKTENFNYSVGAFTETDTLNQELAAIVTTKPKSIKNSKGKFYVGAGTFTNLMNQVDKTTAGMFAQYKGDKLSFGTQLARSQYSKSGYNDNGSIHILTTYKVNDRLTLKNKLINNFDIDEVQGELGIVLNPLKDTDRLKMELTAANYQSHTNTITRQRLKFTTSFRF